MLIIIAGFPAVFIGVFFGASLIIETIFSLDGLGRLGFEAAVARDYPVIFGTLFAFGLIGLLVGIAAWKYKWVDIAVKPILSILQTLPFFALIGLGYLAGRTGFFPEQATVYLTNEDLYPITRGLTIIDDLLYVQGDGGELAAVRAPEQL